jgi:hypothetical protein
VARDEWHPHSVATFRPVQGGPDEEEETAALLLAEEMWSAVKAGVMWWRVARLIAVDTRMVSEWS